MLSMLTAESHGKRAMTIGLSTTVSGRRFTLFKANSHARWGLVDAAAPLSLDASATKLILTTSTNITWALNNVIESTVTSDLPKPYPIA